LISYILRIYLNSFQILSIKTGKASATISVRAIILRKYIF
jgi:hypothetical protein